MAGLWVALLVIAVFSVPSATARVDWHVAAGGTGDGSVESPFGRLQEALDVSQPGDTIVVGPGVYRERLASVRSGTPGAPITIRAKKRGSATMTANGRVLTVGHAHLVLDGMVLDGQFGDDDLVRVFAGGTGFTVRNSEIRRTSRDVIDLGAVHDVLIEGALIHHALNATNGRKDAHGIAAGAVRRLTIRNTEIHTFSGDAFQVDPGRAAPGWSDVTIEGCRFWLEPLPAAVNGFQKGIVPGENAVDTKASGRFPRATLTIRNTEARGFQNGLIRNMAAFNLKEHIDAVVDGVTVSNSEIAFRLRAPAQVRVQNAVVYNAASGVRFEDNIKNLRVWNSTFGTNVERPFRSASSRANPLDIRNVLFLGRSVPKIAAHTSNLAVSAEAFADAARHDYDLASGSPALDRGETIAEIETDRLARRRPQGRGFDVGAYERPVAARR